MSTVKWNLKEAGGKSLRRRTEIRYKADEVDEVPKHTKVQYCTEPKSVNLAAIKRKVIVLSRGGITSGEP